MSCFAGQSLLVADPFSLQVLASIGFGCRQEEHVLRVGPVQKGESITEEDVQRMDRYMLRTWVEINLALRLFMARQGKSLPTTRIYQTDTHRRSREYSTDSLRRLLPD